MHILLLVSLLSAAGLLLDLYVFRNWRRFASPRLRWTLPILGVGMLVMPFVLPTYFGLSTWWAVEPKLLRHLTIGLWALWYVPKVPISAVLVIKDLARSVSWLFGWLQARLATNDPRNASTDLADLPTMSRSEFLRRVGWTAATVPYAVVGYGVFRGLYDFQIRRVTVPVQNLPGALHGLEIAQLSDLHAGSLFSDRPMEDVVDLVLAQRPDLVTITGDFVNNDHREASVILPALARLAAPLGVYAVRGNHDHYASVTRVTDLVRSASVDLLVNDARTLRIDGARLHTIGTDNTGFGQRFANLPAALARADPAGDDARILLAHDPSFWDTHVRPHTPEIDLTLSGHTHGGQMGTSSAPCAGVSPASPISAGPAFTKKHPPDPPSICTLTAASGPWAPRYGSEYDLRSLS